jgi:hypothetical protein
VIDLHGNAWRFPQGHRLRIELAQDDDPYVRRADQPVTVTVARVHLSVPIREVAPGDPGEAGPDIRLRVAARAGGGFGLTVRSATGERLAIDEYEFFLVDALGEYDPLPSDPAERSTSYNGTPGTTYTFAARAIDRRGVPGPLSIVSKQAR